jgi:hypothetical protein
LKLGDLSDLINQEASRNSHIEPHYIFSFNVFPPNMIKRARTELDP